MQDRAMDELKTRLRSMYSHRGDGIPTQFVNPDGREALARIEALEAENARLIDKGDKQAMVLRRLTPDKYPGTWFACGEGGGKDANGLPDRIHVCPAYGADWSVVYVRTEAAEQRVAELEAENERLREALDEVRQWIRCELEPGTPRATTMLIKVNTALARALQGKQPS